MDKQPRPRKSGFYKGIPGFTVRTQAGLLGAAEASIYMWWWRFMKLNPVFWYAQTHKIEPTNAEIKRAYQLAGNLKQADFATWWDRTGQYVFEENQLPADVAVIDVDRFHGHELYQKSIVVEIPLTITVNKIVKDVKRILLDIGYTTDALSVVANSNAYLKLKTQRYSLHTIEHEYWVLLYRLLYPDATDWQIADRLQLSPTTRVRELDQAGTEAAYRRGNGPFARLQALAGRNLRKARALRHNLQYGKFPDYSPIASVSRVQPFGREHHQKYIEATSERNDEFSSPWRKHLIQKYKKPLHDYILRVNRIEQQHETNSRMKERFPDFVAGRSELL